MTIWVAPLSAILLSLGGWRQGGGLLQGGQAVFAHCLQRGPEQTPEKSRPGMLLNQRFQLQFELLLLTRLKHGQQAGCINQTGGDVVGRLVSGRLLMHGRILTARLVFFPAAARARIVSTWLHGFRDLRSV